VYDHGFTITTDLLPLMKLVFLRLGHLSSLIQLLLLSLLAIPAWAQFRVEVTGVGMTQLPVVMAPFKGEASAPQKLASIVEADLERSGQFKGLFEHFHRF
jgi:TolB protein